MHLYNKAITSITWDDIERFCGQAIAENTYLEYKGDFPNDLAKTIAAMANTLGGLILIGVEEMDSGTPKLPLKGIAADRGLEERVLNIILDSMSPPIIPEIATCANTGGDKAIVLVRVPQSEHAPHALHRNSAVYIRTGKRTKPEDLADLDRIDWLRGAGERNLKTCANGFSIAPASDSATCGTGKSEAYRLPTRALGVQWRSSQDSLLSRCVQSTLIKL